MTPLPTPRLAAAHIRIGALLASCLLTACAPAAKPPAASAPPLAAVAPSPSPAQADKSVPGDAAIPIVELMPVLMRYEADLQLSAERLKAVAEYRQANMPARVANGQKLLALRGQLRAAILQGQPADALIQQVAQAEAEHMQARANCATFLRSALSPAQYAQLTRLYLEKLR